MSWNLVRFCVPIALAFLSLVFLLAGWAQGSRDYVNMSLVLAVLTAVTFVGVCLAWAYLRRPRPEPWSEREVRLGHKRGVAPGVVVEEIPRGEEDEEK